jgi:GNAT superfamily N-acetyltransferase
MILKITRDITTIGSRIKFYFEKNNKEIGRGFLFILNNSLHKDPFGFIEDVFIHESHRGHGLGTQIILASIEEAKSAGCYKIICNAKSNNLQAHKLYNKLGFEIKGYKFRINLI